MLTSASFLHHRRLAPNVKFQFNMGSFKSMRIKFQSRTGLEFDVQAPKLKALSIFSGVAGLELGLREFDPQPSASGWFLIF